MRFSLYLLLFIENGFEANDKRLWEEYGTLEDPLAPGTWYWVIYFPASLVPPTSLKQASRNNLIYMLHEDDITADTSSVTSILVKFRKVFNNKKTRWQQQKFIFNEFIEYWNDERRNNAGGRQTDLSGDQEVISIALLLDLVEVNSQIHSFRKIIFDLKDKFELENKFSNCGRLNL